MKRVDHLLANSLIVLGVLVLSALGAELLSKSGWILAHALLGVLSVIIAVLHGHQLHTFTIVKTCSVVPAVLMTWYFETHPSSPRLGWVSVILLSLNMLEPVVVDLFVRRTIDSVLNGIIGLLLIGLLRPGSFRINDRGSLEAHLGWAWNIAYTFWDMAFLAGWWKKGTDPTDPSGKGPYANISTATIHANTLLSPLLAALIVGRSESYMKFRIVTLFMVCCVGYVAFRPALYRLFGFRIDHVVWLRKWVVTGSVLSGCIALLVKVTA